MFKLGLPLSSFIYNDHSTMSVNGPQAGWRASCAPLGACFTFVLPETHIAVMINQSQVMPFAYKQVIAHRYSSQLC